MIILYYPHISLIFTYMHMRWARAFIDSRNKFISRSRILVWSIMTNIDTYLQVVQSLNMYSMHVESK